MTEIQQDPSGFTLAELLEEVRKQVSTEAIPADQQSLILHTVIDILQTCGEIGKKPPPGHDMQEVRGQEHVKRALEVAATGGHNILLIGPPGGGKTLLARTLPSLLPTTSVPYPFRAPHHSIEHIAFTGSGKSYYGPVDEPALPGELTLAHGGVLFMEHLHAFHLWILHALQRAVETREVSLPGKEGDVRLPANVLLIATVEPCPCGYYDDPIIDCRCSSDRIEEFQWRIKEIVQTCFALSIEVPRLPSEKLMNKRQGESSAQIRNRVSKAREAQQARYAGVPHLWVNADLGPLDEIEHYCQIDRGGEKLLKAALDRLHLPAQQMAQIMRIARTIADLAGESTIATNHIAEAIQYRPRPVG